MLCAICSGLSHAFYPCLGNAETITIDDSQSPNGKYFLSIVPEDDQGVAAGKVQIRVNGSGKIESTFEWSGFGVRPDSRAFLVFWNPSSDAFAISYEYTRGYMFYDAYARSTKGWIKLTAPDYISIIFKQQGIAHGGGKGYETPTEWTDNSTLHFNVGGRACIDQTDAFKFYFQAEVWLHLDRSRAVPRFTLEKIVNLPPDGS